MVRFNKSNSQSLILKVDILILSQQMQGHLGYFKFILIHYHVHYLSISESKSCWK